jgi:ribonuclease R
MTKRGRGAGRGGRRAKGPRGRGPPGSSGRQATVTGVLVLTRRGDAFVRPESAGEDVFVPGGRLNTAMDGDRVVVRVTRRPKARNPEGSVLEVLERAHETVVGTLHARHRSSFVVPLDARLQREILIRERSGAEDGDVVLVRLESFGDGRSRPSGAVERVLGKLSDPGVDVLAVALGFGLELDFPREVLVAADEAARVGTEHPGRGRIDRTALLCFTIDPSDAKDHDDALSVEARDEGLVEVGVHIADVSHFVRPEGHVDAEARSRGTSVYLVDRVIPMLPAILSSDVCSLIVDAPRFALSLFMTLDVEGRVRERRYERTVIRCRHGLSYEEAQEVLGGTGSISAELDDALRLLDDRARRIREARHDRGALDLDLPEADVVLGPDGVPVDIQRRERRESHRLIEDYMILANEVVAQDMEARGLDGLYRVHEPPAPEKLEELKALLSAQGLEVPRRKSLRPKDVQILLEAVRPEQKDMVSSLLLRTLAKARYDTENLGHFGLASSGYTHFTSPIRRYPDLVVHRVIAASFLGGEPLDDEEREALGSIAASSSEREQAADEAERATVALKKVEFMERHLGDVFTGRITGVASFGVFVTLDDYFVDGLVHVRAMEDDFYELRPREQALVGERRGRRYRLGDRIEVQVARVDKEARRIDFLATGKRSRVD